MPEHGNPAELSRLVREYERSGVMKFIRGFVVVLSVGVLLLAFVLGVLVLQTLVKSTPSASIGALWGNFNSKVIGEHTNE